jgi:hypothetical protein
MELINYLKEMWSLALQGKGQGILFWVAFYMFVILAYSLLHQIKIASWPSTSGNLLKSGVRKFGNKEWAKSNQEYVVSALYSYVINGKEYQGHKISPWVFVASHNLKYFLEKQLRSVHELPNGKVMVFYDPKKPEKSFLIKPGLKGQIITAMLAIIPFVVYWVKYHG